MPEERFNTVIKDDESLILLMRNLKAFEEDFCKYMMKGSDFNIRLEVRGCKGIVNHVRVYGDSTDRPKGMNGKNTVQETGDQLV